MRRARVRRIVAVGVVAVVGLLQVGLSAAAGSDAPRARRVSTPLGGGSLDSPVLHVRSKGDGSLVLFLTAASNLVADDRNGRPDVFVADWQEERIERVSVSFLGRDPNDGSFPGVLSWDGRYVIFGSSADNLVTGDFNRTPDLFVFDRTTGRTRALSLAQSGRGGGALPDLPPAIDAEEGRWIAFASRADDLVPNDRNEASDIFVVDRETGSIEVLTYTSIGAPEVRTANGPSFGPAMSVDGCQVAFASDAGNLVLGDTNQLRDVFVRDRCTGAIERVSVSSGGEEANGPSQVELANLAISGDGRWVAFTSRATNLDGPTGGHTQIFVRDRLEGRTRLVSRNEPGEVANAPALAPSLDASGRFLVFQSAASNLSSADRWSGTDVFLLDLSDGEIALVSQPAAGGEANGDSFLPWISTDGRRVVFLSAARLVPEDPDNTVDAYVIDNPLYWKAIDEPTPSETPTPLPSETPTPTATGIPTSTATSTPVPTATPLPPSPTVPLTATPSVTRTDFVPSPTATWTAGPTGTTPAAVASPTAAGGGGGGCSCRVDGTEDNASLPQAASLGFFAVLIWLARKRARAEL